MPLASPWIIKSRKKLKPLVPKKNKNHAHGKTNNPSSDETYGVSSQLITGTETVSSENQGSTDKIKEVIQSEGADVRNDVSKQGSKVN